MSFVPWPENRFVRHLEREGHRLRSRLGLSAYDPLDPLALIGTYDEMCTANLLDLFNADHPGMVVLRTHSTAWSAVAYRERPGPWLIVANPWHAETRRRASMMEEVAHIVLEHKPTRPPCVRRVVRSAGLASRPADVKRAGGADKTT